MAECEEIIGEDLDEEMTELAKEELADARAKKTELEEKIKIALIPKDPNDDKNVVVEIRAGRRGRSGAFRRGTYAYVYAFCGEDALEGRRERYEYDGSRRRQGSRIHNIG